MWWNIPGETNSNFGETTMDDLDEHLLARLRENARAPVAELARNVYAQPWNDDPRGSALVRP